MWPFAKSRDVHQLIYDYAEHHRDADLREVFRHLRGRQIFSPLSADSRLNGAHGESVTVGAEDHVAIARGRVGDREVVVFFADQNDRRLLPRYIGMTFPEALAMAEKMPDCGGILLYNKADSYVGFAKEHFDAAREMYNG
jgi:hypothetical protein